MGEYLRFHKMITPVIIQALFWVGATVAVLAGIVTLTQNALGGLLIIVLGPVVVRIYAELLIVLFEINEALQDIRGSGRMRPAPAPGAAPTPAAPSF